MSVFDVIAVNDVLRSKSETYFQNVADYLGVDAGTTGKAAAEAMSLAGIVIMGAGTSPKQRKSLIGGIQAEKKRRIELENKKAAEKQATEQAKKQAEAKVVTSSPQTGEITYAKVGVYNDYSEYGVRNLTPATQHFLNTLSSNFYNKTGVVLNVTSTLRPNDYNSWHCEGIAFDVANDEFLYGTSEYTGQELRDLYWSMAHKMGGKPLDEYPGGEGVQYNRGYNFHVSVHNQTQWN